MLYPIYRWLTTLAGPLVPVLLDRRLAAGREDLARRAERLGIASRPRPAGRVVWIHGASVGEALSVQVLIRRLLEHDSGLTVVLTTGTVTSARLMADRLPGRAIHQFVPVDRPAYASRFIDHWRPDLVLWTESELWPNLLTEIGRRRIPAALINARMSARSFARWRRLPRTAGALLGIFDLVLPWDEAAAAKLSRLGARRLGPVGNLKFSADPPAADPAALAALRRAVAGRPLWLAASTHEGEEPLCLDAHAALAEAHPGLLTLIAPRHPARGPSIAALAAARGLATARRATGALPDAAISLYIADTLGELGTLLRLAPIVLVGGSLVPHGGHNPVEPAQLGNAILYGPHMANFADITRQLEAAGGGLTVDDGPTLTAALRRLLAEPDEVARRGAAARAVAERNRGVAEAAMAALLPLLDRRRPAA